MRFVKYHLPIIVCAVGIFIVSSIIPPPEILELIPLFLYSDKVFHALIYSLLSFLILRALYVSKPNKPALSLKITSFTAAFSYGIIIEIYQYFLPARTMEIMDAFSNGLGAAAGILFFSKIQQSKIKIRKPNGKDNTV